MCIGVWPACVCLYFACLMTILETRRGCCTPWVCCYRCLRAQGIKPRSPGRAAVLLSTEPSLQSLNKFNKSFYTQSLP